MKQGNKETPPKADALLAQMKQRNSIINKFKTCKK